ncbi:MAG: hypothetical protein IKJ96_00770 [Alistipes sp.]|nr:hypothetical protein [Alistipes sp.]
MMDKLDFPDRQSYDMSTKVRFLKDMITLSLVNGKLDNEEYKSCQDYAHALGLHLELTDALITEIHHKLKKN